MEKLYLCLFFIIGCVMGSFYHVIATRVSTGGSIIKPASHCTKCKHTLRWYELIPVISYLIQGGKCRNCKTQIPIGCLLMELSTGILFAVCYHVFDFQLELFTALIFVSSLMIIIISDIEYMIILDEVLVFAVTAIIGIRLLDIGIYATCINILEGIGAFATMLLIKKLGDLMFKQESLGGGDIKLMFIVGLVIGYDMAVCNIFFATFIAFPIALFLLIFKKDNIIPFGPFLSMAAILLYIWGLTFTDIINFIIY